MRLTSSFLVVGSVALALALSSPVQAENPRISLQITGDQLSWTPNTPHEGASLAVSAPDGSVVERSFPNGGPLSISAFEFADFADDALIDGTYSWQLTLTPVIDADTRKVMDAARASGDASVIDSLREAGKIPDSEAVNSSGYFTVVRGHVINPNSAVEPVAAFESKAADVVVDQDEPTRDQVILDDLIVDGSACIGFDCVSGESFGFDTIRIKENNLRISAVDTSTTGSFPSTDWQITFNDSTNGGANKFAIDDISGGRTPFTIEAGAPSHSLYVEDGGRIGFGTNTPVVDLHLRDGDTPTLRLEQDGSSGFGAQTWDVAGNEAGFFIRDATNGSTLPFRIIPAAPSEALVIDAGGDIGIGTGTSADASLEVRRTDGTAKILVHDASSTASNSKIQLELNSNGASQIALVDSSTLADWRFQNLAGDFRITKAGTGLAEMTLDGDGNLWARGDINSDGNTIVPDYVFESDYDLMTMKDLSAFIRENGHLPNVPSAGDIKARGSVNLSQMQMRLLEKVEELTLYTLAQESTITALTERLAILEQGK